MKTTLKDNRGFTLVELAIVMIIIGLLIGGTLKGQQLIESAKTTSTISQIKNITTQSNSFYDTYGAYAGDMDNATTRVVGCDVAGNNCANGDGDGFIEVTAGLDPDAADLLVLGNSETNLFWKHLTLAGLVGGMVPDQDLTTDLAYGESSPASSLKGGFDIYFDQDITELQTGGAGLVLRLSNQTLPGATAVNTEGLEAMKPLIAGNIDRKIDDGVADTGTAFSFQGAGGECTDGADNYVEVSTTPDCAQMYLIN